MVTRKCAPGWAEGQGTRRQAILARTSRVAGQVSQWRATTDRCGQARSLSKAASGSGSQT
jgi:hypothetical protein